MGEGQTIERDLSLLVDAFDCFSKASTTLESSYNELERRVEELNLEVAEKNNFLINVLEGLPVGVLVTDKEGRVGMLNNTACSILEASGKTLYGNSMGAILHAADGTPRYALATNGGAETELVIESPNGRRKTLTLSSTELKNLKEERTGLLVVIKDISAIKRLEESSQREKRLSAMGQMAASIAHQIRNPLASIELFASLISEEPVGEEENNKYAGEIMQSVKTLNNTLSNMLLFANTSRPEKSEVIIEDFFKELETVVSLIVHDKGVSVELSQGKVERGFFDSVLMRQVLVNLIMNATDAASGAARARVSVSAESEEDNLVFKVADNGSGIGSDETDRVFDPFFTTKARGTGLGLTVVNNIVKSHDGFVEVDSSSKDGTTFTVTLPLGGGRK